MNTQALKQAMAERQITSKQLASQTGISPSYLSLVLNGQRNCSIKLANRITSALKLKQKEIITIFFK